MATNPGTGPASTAGASREQRASKRPCGFFPGWCTYPQDQPDSELAATVGHLLVRVLRSTDGGLQQKMPRLQCSINSSSQHEAWRVPIASWSSNLRGRPFCAARSALRNVQWRVQANSPVFGLSTLVVTVSPFDLSNSTEGIDFSVAEKVFRKLFKCAVNIKCSAVTILSCNEKRKRS